MTLLVDTSVWSLAFRRDATQTEPDGRALRHALERGDGIVGTGLVLQELVQGFAGPKTRDSLIERFAALPFVNPDRRDHIDAAKLRNLRRKQGVQLGTIALCWRNCAFATGWCCWVPIRISCMPRSIASFESGRRHEPTR